MPNRAHELIDAYFHKSREEYSELVSAVSSTGGLTSDEVTVLTGKLLNVDAWTIVRHAGVFSRARSLDTDQVEMTGANLPTRGGGH